MLDQIQFQVRSAILPHLLGVDDANLRYLESRFESQVTARGDTISVRGPADEIERVKRVILDLEALCFERREIRDEDMDIILQLAGFNGGRSSGRGGSERGDYENVTCGSVRARGSHQARYIRMMEKLAIVFATGPAGTGKTYLAVAMAVDQFQRRLIDRIILVRPVVETGETLGFLPGDIKEKVDPYFRPLYDALDDMLTRDRLRRLIDRGDIEIAPLAYMRGRTLNNALVILDEAQNTTCGQMKMFLTRLGTTSRAVLTGDLTQVDLPEGASSGLVEARDILRGVDGIGFIEFTEDDVVRHRLIADILRAYNVNDAAKQQAAESE